MAERKMTYTSSQSSPISSIKLRPTVQRILIYAESDSPDSPIIWRGDYTGHSVGGNRETQLWVDRDSDLVDAVNLALAICEKITSEHLLDLDVYYADYQWTPHTWATLARRASRLHNLVVHEAAALAALIAAEEESSTPLFPSPSSLDVEDVDLNLMVPGPGGEHIPMHDAFTSWIERRTALEAPIKVLDVRCLYEAPSGFQDRLQRVVDGQVSISLAELVTAK
ncbi:hypothetical protein BV25DRAFT_1921269 [Artomyces pyxidatus]|uniref:Uncharacterized protein n=1 Tax=Artomyces pyxidatus TaxID=48021 RepID=A0ACB8SIN5_9AGAM|nr:hypothetical protein BV25DRAFT_1921269 [Artomyces pyxidatus]